MIATDVLLKVEGLTVEFAAPHRNVVPVKRVSFEVMRGRTLGIVGESGSGKSMTLRALLGLIPHPGTIVDGTVLLEGTSLVGLPERRMRRLRGSSIAMISQDPMTSLNPVFSIGNQLVEVLRLKRHLSRAAAHRAAEDLLERVGIPSPRRRLREYPHQLSGGMRQRVMIALALACEPLLLLADEPTTALDATVQDQILLLLSELRDEYGMAMVLVSHDFGVIAQACDDVAVMYAGSLVEQGGVDEVLDSPRHPYTRALAQSVVRVGGAGELVARLPTIPGQPPNLAMLPDGCAFADRCAEAAARCRSGVMQLDRPLGEHGSACIRSDELL